jgi:predicted NBD/HSP70 family sugar kinase
VRPSTSTVALAVNPEVDAITVGLVGLGGEVIRKIRMPTQQPPTAIEVANITAAIFEGMRSELETHYRVLGVGVAVPGLTRTVDGVVTYAPHLGWRDEPIAALISEATGFPTSAANDASLGAGAELIFGAGQGCLDLIYLNGGAGGIGGGVVVGGAVRAGRDGFAGELGHTLVTTDGLQCHCGASGCLEAEISLARLQKLVALREGDLDAVERALLEGAKSVVMPEVHRQIDYLAVTLCNAVNIFNPERIVLGGFLGTIFAFAPNRLIEKVRSQSLDGPGEFVQISRTALGSNILMIGAAELVFAGVLADPVGAVSEVMSIQE